MEAPAQALFYCAVNKLFYGTKLVRLCYGKPGLTVSVGCAGSQAGTTLAAGAACWEGTLVSAVKSCVGSVTDRDPLESSGWQIILKP